MANESETEHSDHPSDRKKVRRRHEGRRHENEKDDQGQTDNESTDADPKSSRHVQRFIKKWEMNSDSGEALDHQQKLVIETDAESNDAQHIGSDKKKRQKKKTKPRTKVSKSSKHSALKKGKDQTIKDNNERYVPAQTEEEKVMEQMTEREINLEMIAAVEESKISFSKGFDMKTASRFQKELELHRLNHLKGWNQTIMINVGRDTYNFIVV